MKRFLMKFTSMKVLMTIWAMVLLTIAVVTKNTDSAIFPILAAAPMAYIGANVYEDKIHKGANQ